MDNETFHPIVKAYALRKHYVSTTDTGVSDDQRN